MTRVAVVLAPGFEEIEAIAPIDILRRADFQVDVIGFNEYVEGSHQIVVKVDKVLEGVLDASTYDAILLPGGMPGAHHLKENLDVIQSLKEAYANGKIVAAICAAPIVLEAAGLLEGKKFTHFPGFEDQLTSGLAQSEAVVVADDRVLTARGAGVAMEFGFTLVDLLGGDSQALRSSMQYDYLFK